MVNPPATDYVAEVLGVRTFPVGLVHLAAYLREEGFDVEILDCPAEGIGPGELRSAVKGFDAVGFTATTPAAPSAYRAAREIRDLVDVVFLGGPHPTFMDREAVSESGADFVVRGEGEVTTTEALEAFDTWGEPDLSDVKGITYRADGTVVRNPDRPPVEDLDSLPLPAYDLVDIDAYAVDGKRFVPVVTSRGCPFGCAFCASSRIFGRRWRGRSPERVVQEVSLLVEEYGVERIEIVDDVFTLNKKRALRVCEGLREEGVDVPWDCSSRADTVDRELAGALAKGGCETVYVGAESGDDETLKRIGKGITTSDVLSCVRKLKEAGLRVVASFIIGFPWEGRKDVLRTVKFAKKCGVDYAQFTVLTPYPGTPMFEEMKERGLIETYDWSKYTTVDPVIRTEHLTSKDLSILIKYAYLSFYADPRFILKRLSEGDLFIVKKILKEIPKTVVRALIVTFNRRSGR